MTTSKYSLQQFIKEEKEQTSENFNPNGLIKVGISNAIVSTNLINIANSSDKVEKFKDELLKDLQSEETVCEISNIVGTPLNNESEDEFVERSLMKLRTYLNNKFK